MIKNIITKLLSNKLRLTCMICILVAFILVFISMFFSMLNVTKYITSANLTWMPTTQYEYKLVTTYQCSYQYTFSGYQYVCGPVSSYQFVPVTKYMPSYIYTTTSFTNNVHLYDMILSAFHLGTKQLFFVAPILLLSFAGCSLIFIDKSILKKIGFISLSFLMFILFGSTIGVLRLFINNTKYSSLACSFYLLIVASLLVLANVVISYIQSLKTPINENHLSNKNLDISILVRFVIIMVMVLLSEVAVTNIYGFILYLFLTVSLVLSLDKHLVGKILLIVSSSGLMVYSLVTMIMALVEGLSKTSFFKIISVDSLISRVLFIAICVVSIILVIKEISHSKNKLQIEQNKEEIANETNN